MSLARHLALLLVAQLLGGGCASEAAHQAVEQDADVVEQDADVVEQDAGVDPFACWSADIQLAEPPDHVPPMPMPQTNPSTVAGVALGRRLFFDPDLSVDGTVSCASCHEPSLGFTTDEALTTRGVSGLPLTRNAPTLWNVGYFSGGLFWDGGSKNLESLGLAPLTHPDEMGREGQLEPLIEQLRLDVTYSALFERAFGPGEVTLSKVLRALAQFQRNIVAFDSPWDRAQRGEVELSDDQLIGEQVFTRACARCHTAGLFSDLAFHNNGLDIDSVFEHDTPQSGHARISLSIADAGKYKTPTLRDVAQTAPYMHDGRFATLADVIKHYRSGMQRSATLDPGFAREGAEPGVTMTDAEAEALEVFLRDALREPIQAALAAPACP